MSLRRPLIPQALLLASLLGAFGFLSYYPSLHAKELGELCALALFFWLALATRVNSRWALYVVVPAVLLAVFAVLYALVFTFRTGASLLPSISSQRYYIYVLLGPIIYMLYLRGWRLPDFRRILVTTMVLIVVNRIVGDLTASSTSLLLSGRFFVLQLGPYYDEQTYLFRRMDLSSLFLTLYFGRGIFKSRTLPSFVFRLTLAAVSATVLLVSLPRTLVMGTVVALLLYGVFLSRPVRARASVFMLPLLVSALALSVPLLIGLLLSLLRHDLSFLTRSQSTGIAWDSIAQYPVFGFGQDSNGTVSYQDLFGESFYPSDVGLTGVVFQFGIVGLILYLIFGVWLVANMLRLLWTYRGRVGPMDGIFVWALFIVSLTFLIISPIQARFIFSDGLPIAAFCWGLLMAHKHGPVAKPTSAFQASTAARRRAGYAPTLTEVPR